MTLNWQQSSADTDNFTKISPEPKTQPIKIDKGKVGSSELYLETKKTSLRRNLGPKPSASKFQNKWNYFLTIFSIEVPKNLDHVSAVGREQQVQEQVGHLGVHPEQRHQAGVRLRDVHVEWSGMVNKATIRWIDNISEQVVE